MVWLYIILSVLAVSLVSLAGVFTISIRKERLEKFLIYFISFAAGTLLGDAFIHLIPKSFANNDGSLKSSIIILLGILFFLFLEKIIHWRHCHLVADKDHPHPFAYSILAGDTVHNFIDGIIIAASFIVSVPLGIATTLAVIFHEVPQEIGDFGSLLYAGFSKGRAILFNFLSALAAFAGVLAVAALGKGAENFSFSLIPFAAGGFIYIASVDLIPELKKHCELSKSAMQLVAFILGILLMLGLVVLE